MKCPSCGHHEDRVIDSRPVEDGSAIRRRRECLDCRFRFTTFEKIETIPLYVVKKDGSRETFDRDKLIASVMKAASKRPVSAETVEHLATEIEQKCQNSLNHEVASQDIGEMVMQGLREIDEVAYIRFASVYRQFTDVNGFLETLVNLMDEDSKPLDDELLEKLRHRLERYDEQTAGGSETDGGGRDGRT